MVSSQKRGEIRRMTFAVASLLAFAILVLFVSDGSSSSPSGSAITGYAAGTAAQNEEIGLGDIVWTFAPFAFIAVIVVIVVVSLFFEKQEARRLMHVKQYVEDARSIGYSEEEITEQLSSVGWDGQTVRRVLRK